LKGIDKAQKTYTDLSKLATILSCADIYGDGNHPKDNAEAGATILSKTNYKANTKKKEFR
jgi:hypothetical protein